MAALQNAWNLEFFVEWVGTDLAVHLERLFKLLVQHIDRFALLVICIDDVVARGFQLSRGLKLLILNVSNWNFQINKTLALVSDIVRLQLNLRITLLLIRKLLPLFAFLIPPFIL